MKTYVLVILAAVFVPGFVLIARAGRRESWPAIAAGAVLVGAAMGGIYYLT